MPPINKLYLDELVLANEEIVSEEMTKCYIKETNYVSSSYNDYYYITITNFRIVIWFNYKGIAENKIQYVSCWYPNTKNTPKVTFLDIFLFENCKNKIINNVKYSSDKKGKHITIKVFKYLPSYYKIYHEKSEEIYKKIASLIN